MADQCIICLEDLDIYSPNPDLVLPERHLGPHDVSTTITSDPSQIDNQPLIASIQPCSHVLHDDCLKEWSQKANSCPICRQNFNTIDVYDRVGGNKLSTYAVENKKQVADFDVNAWIEDQIEDEESVPCPICDSADNEEILLLCDGCEANYHTHCVGLERVPRGDWYCMECREKGFGARAERRPTQRPVRQPRPPNQRTQAQVRRARNHVRDDNWHGAWDFINHRIQRATDIDVDNEHGDESLAAYRRYELARSSPSQWAQRASIAGRQGARDVFRNATQPLMSAADARRSKEEEKAWDAFEKAREGHTTGVPSRKRKSRSRSTTASPKEAVGEPERKLKRPRTRRVVGQPSSASRPASESSRPIASPRRPSPPLSRPNAGPSFLSSLLKEVEMSSSTDDEGPQMQPLGIFAASPTAEYSSPILSPVTSSYSTPRPMSLTPPPHCLRKSGSPIPLASIVEPVFPPANYSPNRSPPEQSSSYDAEIGSGEVRQPRPRRRHTILQEFRDRSPTREPSSRRTDPRSNESSPNRSPMSREAKEDVSRIVRSALEPHYKKPAGITKEQYRDINRLVSHMLYDKISDISGALDEGIKSAWEQIASAEVAKAVDGLSA